MTETPPCPNHGVPMDYTGDGIQWICPISGAVFEAEFSPVEQEEEVEYDKFGNEVKKWKLTQVDGGEGG